MMAGTFIVFALLSIACSYASPLRTASIYGSPLLVVPIIVQELDDPQALTNEKSMYALNDNSKIANDIVNLEKRSAEEANNDDDLETAAGTNVLRPLFVYRQQVAYRQRARDAVRRGRRI
ncbi:PREDICTED: uncharacterized protein LOC105459744 [Wasmannia auropunctata]|uniref:uncharacterized protein LOC105459744 n=1 Tax=Wasmannia auropunctata TaxID=64793 RepID=UPI0005F0698D|nr:PREDICTED: uncharacterized protein LOC105459744 [Wasmannia auropunctata]